MKLRSILVLSVASILMVGCGGQDSTERIWSASNVFEPSSEWSNDSDAQMYLNLIATNHPEVIVDFGEEWLIEFAHNICATVQSGTTWQDMLNWSESPMTEESEFLVAAAIVVYCPDYEKEFLQN